MKELDTNGSQTDSALNCYRTALRDLRSNLVISSGEFKREIQTRLDRLILTVSRKTTNEMLESTAAKLTEVLSEYRSHEELVFEHEQVQLRRTVEALEGLVSAITKQDEEHNASLGAVLSGLENTLFEGDLLATHRSLQEQIRKLRACIVTMSGDSQRRGAGFEEQIQGLRTTGQRHADLAAESAEQRQLDTNSVLTGYLENCNLFSLALVRIEDIDQLAQHWSLSARKKLLSAVEARLRQSMGSTDRVHPWLDGEFLAVVRSSLARAVERAEKIRGIVTGAWNLDLPLGTAQITIRCSIGVVEYAPGDDLSSLMARAETAVAADRERHTRKANVDIAPQ